MQFAAMRYRSSTPPELRNDSNSEGARSAKEILLQLDPNFSRAVGILNKYMPGDDSSSYNLDNLNQNKALGTDSELNSLSHGNTTSASRETRVLGQSDRGGSTFSDLHNTEYLEEYRDNKSKFSPIQNTISSKATDPGSGQHTPPTRLNPPVRTKSPASLSDAPASAASITARTSSQPSSQSGPPSKSTPKPVWQAATKRDTTLDRKLETKTTSRSESKSEPKSNVKPAPGAVAVSRKAPKRSNEEFPTQTHQPKTQVTPLKHPKTAERVEQKTPPKRRQSTPHSMHSRDEDKRQQEDDNEDEESGEYDDEEGEGDEGSESETEYTNEFLEPDPSALRDLDNASPKTIALCRRHQCHYCLFVYFPSATVDEDLMPFRRKAFADKVAKLQNPDHVREVKDTKCARDAYADRRIKCIERQSGTQIRLSDLDPSSAFVKGLPRRRLTIAGPSFAHIGCALNLFESLLPKVIKSAIFPYRLPKGASTRFSAGDRVSSAFHWGYGRMNGSVTLRRQLDDKGGWRSFLVTNKD